MKNTLILFGDIQFESGFGGVEIATIHEITETLLVPATVDAENIGERLVNVYDAYIIPSQYEGTIIWK